MVQLLDNLCESRYSQIISYLRIEYEGFIQAIKKARAELWPTTLIGICGCVEDKILNLIYVSISISDRGIFLEATYHDSTNELRSIPLYISDVKILC